MAKKAEEFYGMLRDFIEYSDRWGCSEYSGYGSVLLNMDKFKKIFNEKYVEESVNVYKDVIAIVNEQKETNKKGTFVYDKIERIAKLAQLRIDYFENENPDVMNLVYFKQYMPSYKSYEYMFSAKTLKKALSYFKLVDFIEVRTVYGKHNIEHCESKGYLKLSSGTRRYRGAGPNGEEIEKSDIGAEFLFPRMFIICETDFLEKCMLLEYPYLAQYKLHIYKLEFENNSATEFYVKVGLGKEDSLYVPFKALKDRKPELITERMLTYFSFLYKNDNTKARVQEKMDLIKTEIARSLYKDIKAAEQFRLSIKPGIKKMLQNRDAIPTKDRKGSKWYDVSREDLEYLKKLIVRLEALDFNSLSSKDKSKFSGIFHAADSIVREAYLTNFKD